MMTKRIRDSQLVVLNTLILCHGNKSTDLLGTPCSSVLSMFLGTDLNVRHHFFCIEIFSSQSTSNFTTGKNNDSTAGFVNRPAICSLVVTYSRFI